ncbi:MAG: hypothetical protein KJI71_02905 [Patescibacteria group bacterium]|nr:hypothetical protein [Patescibacteria group bacterium]
MFQIRNGNKAERGALIVEILVVVAIITITLTGLLGLISFSLGTSTLIRQNNQADDIAQGIVEQVRNFRDGTSWEIDGLGTLTTGIDYYLQESGSPQKWQLIEGTKTVNGFNTKVTLGDVMRDSNDDIVSSGGSIDSDTKKVTVDVSWEEKNRSHQIELITYLTNWRQ